MFFSHPNILCLFSVWYVFSGLSPSEMTGGQIDRTRRLDGGQIDSQSNLYQIFKEFPPLFDIKSTIFELN